MKYQVREKTGWSDAPKSELFNTLEEAKKALEEIKKAEGEKHELFELYINRNPLAK